MNRDHYGNFRLIAALTCLATAVAAQTPEQLDLTAVGNDTRWKVANRTASIVETKGKRALKLSEGAGMGLVWRDGYDFANGVMDIDILGRSQPVQGSFVGVAFHVVDAQTHDAVYFRPFNFRASDPERHSHAVQYVSDPQWTWQILREKSPGNTNTRGPRTRWRSVVSRPHRCRSAKGERLRGRRNDTLPRRE